jgi:hypothetical protein
MSKPSSDGTIPVKQCTVTGAYLRVPVAYEAKLKKLSFFRGEQPVFDVDARLDDQNPDTYYDLDMGRFLGLELTASIEPETGLDFVFVDATAPWAAEAFEKRGDLAVAWVVDGPLWPVLSESGSIAEALRRTLREPASLSAGLDHHTWRAAALTAKGVDLGADAVVIADDLGGSEGLLVTPEFAHDEVIPRLARVATAAGGRVPMLLHSDGDVRTILPALRSAGYAGLHSGGLSREDFESLFWEARRHHLAVLGGIPAASLGRGRVAAIQAGTRMAMLAQAGGLLVADDGGITTAAEIDSYSSAVGAARGFVPAPDSPR